MMFSEGLSSPRHYFSHADPVTVAPGRGLPRRTPDYARKRALGTESARMRTIIFEWALSLKIWETSVRRPQQDTERREQRRGEQDVRKRLRVFNLCLKTGETVQISLTVSNPFYRFSLWTSAQMKLRNPPVKLQFKQGLSENCEDCVYLPATMRYSDDFNNNPSKTITFASCRFTWSKCDCDWKENCYEPKLGQNSTTVLRIGKKLLLKGSQQ